MCFVFGDVSASTLDVLIPFYLSTCQVSPLQSLLPFPPMAHPYEAYALRAASLPTDDYHYQHQFVPLHLDHIPDGAFMCLATLLATTAPFSTTTPTARILARSLFLSLSP